MPKPGAPEAFKVLIKELQSLALDVKVLDKNNEEIDLQQTFDDDDDLGLQPVIEDEPVFEEEHVEVEKDFEGYDIDEPEDLGADLDFNLTADVFDDKD